MPGKLAMSSPLPPRANFGYLSVRSVGAPRHRSAAKGERIWHFINYSDLNWIPHGALHYELRGEGQTETICI